MDDIRAEIIKAINRGEFLNDITKIQFGVEFNNPPWALEGFMELVKRQSPLSVDEGKILGLEDAIRCMAARETCRNASSQYGYRYSGSKPVNDHRNGPAFSALQKWFADDHRLFGDSSVPVERLERGHEVDNYEF